jgi:undecaprenyl diphosphate synthase
MGYMMNDGYILPKHIAIIMDGNGRWAEKRHLPKVFGHRQGAKSVDIITEYCARLGVDALTLYSFSTENWRRSQEEIDALMDLLYDYLEDRYPKLQKNNIRLNAIGRLDGLPGKVRARLSDVMARTRDNNKMILTLALNYGSRQEIADAAAGIAKDLKNNIISSDEINEGLLNRYLYTRSLPDVDMLIRTSGEFRLSNFLLWQISYAEIFITKTLWPDFRERDLDIALKEFAVRDRRFGGR